MKSIFIFFLLSFWMLITISGQGNWEVMNEGFDYQAQSIDYLNRDTGWIAGRKGLFKTIDGAETWEWVNNIPIQGIDFWNDTLGWAITGLYCPRGPNYIDDTIYKTVNGGMTWIPQNAAEGTYDLLVTDDSTIYAAGWDTVKKTIDGGLSWKTITPPNQRNYYVDACFVNSDTGIVVYNTGPNFRHTFFKTYDGGGTWIEKSTELQSIDNVTFIDGLTAYFTAADYDNEYLNTGLYKTTDAFNSWSRITDSDMRVSVFGFIGTDTIIALAYDDESNWHFIRSIDGGYTWTNIHQLQMPALGSHYMHVFHNTIYFHNDGIGNSFMLKSIDQVSHWSYLNISFPIHDIHFVNREYGFLVGSIGIWHGPDLGYMLFTKDTGHTWNPVSLPSDPFIWDSSFRPSLYFLNDSVGILSLGPSGFLMPNSFTSIDGGETWVESITEGRLLFHSFNDSISWQTAESVIAENMVYVQVSRTLNGGSSWDILHSYSANEKTCMINALFAINKETAYGVGEGGRIMQFTEQDFREIKSGTTLPLNCIYFIDEINGLICGGYSNSEDFLPIILLTEDGGDNWKTGPDLPYLIHDLYFPDGPHGFAVGEDGDGKGVILETTDGGNIWNVTKGGLPAKLNTVHFTDGYGWAVGDNGLILKMIDTTYTSDRAEIANNASIIQLQNYPNPFHSKTVISYQLPELSEVELNIYDLFGRKLATLLKEWQPPGNYEQNWNADNMEPGVYFCELKINQRRTVIKMILYH